MTIGISFTAETKIFTVKKIQLYFDVRFSLSMNRERHVFYDFTYTWNLKITQKKMTKQVHRHRGQDWWLPGVGEWELGQMSEAGQKV